MHKNLTTRLFMTVVYFISSLFALEYSYSALYCIPVINMSTYRNIINEASFRHKL